METNDLIKNEYNYNKIYNIKMSNDMETLSIKLDELNINLQLIKKMLNRDDCKVKYQLIKKYFYN